MAERAQIYEWSKFQKLVFKIENGSEAPKKPSDITYGDGRGGKGREGKGREGKGRKGKERGLGKWRKEREKEGEG